MKRESLGAGWAALFILGLAGCAPKSQTAQIDPQRNQEQVSQDIDQLDFENPPIAEEEYEAQQRGEVPPKFDIPIVRNAKVEQWIEYFQKRGRKWFAVYLERSGKYIPFMQRILREHDLPEDLVYLAMIESGFSTKAYSRARAVGPWQFMKATGRLYGLEVNFWVDERRDPEKSTIAAARHLKDLFDQFQSWKLAAAAYNAGAGKVSRAIRRYRTEDFWELSRGRYLRPETRHYVPKLIAAALIAKEPEKYGFKDIQMQDPLEYDKIVLEKPVNLMQLADKAGADFEELMTINPELNHPITPPGVKDYELRVPRGRSNDFMAAYEGLTDADSVQFTAHKVRKGESLHKIANIYKVPVSEIKKLNGLASHRVRQGRTLLIPVPLDHRLSAASRRAETEMRKPPQRSKTQAIRAKYHVVRRGDNLNKIAKRYGVSVAEIMDENNIRRTRLIPGKRLVIPPSS